MNGLQRACCAGSVVLVTSCGDQASVGRDTQSAVQRAGECELPWRCELLDPPFYTTSDGAPTKDDVTPLAPTWTKHAELSAAHEGYRRQDLTIPMTLSAPQTEQQLARGRDGRFWLFDVDARKFEALLLDADGEIVERARFSAPDSVEPSSWDDLEPARLGRVDQHASGPVVPVIWSGACTEGGQPGVCAFADVFVFDQTTTPTARVSAPPASDGALPTGQTFFEAVYRSKDGGALLGVRMNNPSRIDPTPAHLTVNQTDLRGELTWSLELPITPLAPLEGDEELSHHAFPLATGAIAPNGDLVQIVYETVPRANGRANAQEPVGIMRVSSDRQATLLKFGAFFPFLLPQTQSWGLALGASRVEFTPSGDLVLIHTAESGDLVVFRFIDDVATMHWAQRDDYRDLVVGPSAIDDEGTIYVATATGGREYEHAEPRLCVFPLARVAHCYAIEHMPVSLHAAAADIVYAVGPGGLHRFDVPIYVPGDEPAN